MSRKCPRDTDTVVTLLSSIHRLVEDKLVSCAYQIEYLHASLFAPPDDFISAAPPAKWELSPCNFEAINRAAIDRYLGKPWKSEKLIQYVKELLTEFIIGRGIDYQKYLDYLDKPTLCRSMMLDTKSASVRFRIAVVKHHDIVPRPGWAFQYLD